MIGNREAARLFNLLVLAKIPSCINYFINQTAICYSAFYIKVFTLNVVLHFSLHLCLLVLPVVCVTVFVAGCGVSIISNQPVEILVTSDTDTLHVPLGDVWSICIKVTQDHDVLEHRGGRTSTFERCNHWLYTGLLWRWIRVPQKSIQSSLFFL